MTPAARSTQASCIFHFRPSIPTFNVAPLTVRSNYIYTCILRFLYFLYGHSLSSPSTSTVSHHSSLPQQHLSPIRPQFSSPPPSVISNALRAIFQKNYRFWSVTRASRSIHQKREFKTPRSLAAVVWLEIALRLKDFNVFSHGHSSWILNRCPEQPSGWETYEMYASANRKNSHEYTLTAQPPKNDSESSIYIRR